MQGYASLLRAGAAVVAPPGPLPGAAVRRGTDWEQGVLRRFDPIALDEMGNVALLRRTDTKYVMSAGELALALSRLAADYRILEIAGRRRHHYQTLYFDTPDLMLYRQHHSGRRNRYKVRERAYQDSDLVYLEVKHKLGRHTTRKSRVRTARMSAQIGPGVKPFLREHYPYAIEGLRPTLLNAFERITLVSKESIERLTLDVAIGFRWEDTHEMLDGLAIAELKQDGFSADSPFVRQMRALGVRPGPVSKYCTGISLLYPDAKTNRFKPRLRRIQKAMQGGSDGRRTH
jgi:hypothetical protein